MKYHKIQTVYKRDPVTKYKTLLEGEYSLPEFEYLADNEWVWTEKVDGTNIRVMWDGWKKLSFGGRTDNAQIPTPLVNKSPDGVILTNVPSANPTIGTPTKITIIFPGSYVFVNPLIFISSL